MLGLHNFSGMDGEHFSQVAPAKTSQPFGKEPRLCGGLPGWEAGAVFPAILCKDMAL